MTPPRLHPTDSVIVVVDVQERLLAAMPGATPLVEAVGFLIDVAAVVDVPVRATEQYPKGLGPTVPAIEKRLTTRPFSKTEFSCCGCKQFAEALPLLGRQSVVLVGMETHVCVAQTALDLIEAGFQVFVPADAVAARRPLDHDVALRRMERAGATITTAEAVAFEWVGDAARPAFKAVSALVKARPLPPLSRDSL